MVNQVNLEASLKRPFIVISGAGPAGLSCAFKAIENGNRVVVLEKRSLMNLGRPQPVILAGPSLSFLKNKGIYQSLFDKNLMHISKLGQATMRLVDLEKAMRSTLEAHSSVIQYETQIKDIVFNESDQKMDLLLEGGGKIESVDLLINAEGYHSSTNKLLNNRHVEVLDKQTIVISLLQEDRPKIENIKSFAVYMQKTFRNLVQAIYYYALWLFRAAVFSDHFFSDNRQITIGLNLRTPGQSYVAFGLSKEKSEELLNLSEAVKEGVVPESDLLKFVQHWTSLALCEVNCFVLLTKIAWLFGVHKHRFIPVSWSPVDSYFIPQIQSDYIERASIKKGSAAILMVGDSLASVDPSTGLGCNVAIQQADHVMEVIHAIEKKESLDQALIKYDQISEKVIGEMHERALDLRKVCRVFSTFKLGTNLLKPQMISNK